MRRKLLALLCFVLGQVGYWALEWRMRLEPDADFYKVGGND